jgi:hypothetical protein
MPVDPIFRAPSDTGKMSSTAIANLSDDGVADTLGLVGATCGFTLTFPFNDPDSARNLSSLALR